MSRTPRPPMPPPPPPHDLIMGPPPLPPQLAQQKLPEPADIAEKYRRLKRKYFELEERHKESQLQLQSSGERNVKWRSERAHLLDRITELETNPVNNPPAHGLIPAPPFTAFPRSLLSKNSQEHFVSNLRLAIHEIEHEDPNVDPLLLSRHVGPHARKRQEAELRERQEEEAREARRAARRPKPVQKSKDIAPLTYAPAPHPASAPHPSMSHNPSPPVLVSNSGTRLRLKPPAPPHAEDVPSSAHGRPHASTPLSHQSQPRSESPVSPMLSPQDDYPMTNVAMAEQYQPVMPAPTQGPMQMILRASSTASSSSSSRPSEIQRHAKPKRLKAHTVTTKSFSIPVVPRDKKGRPLLPLNVGIMTVVNLGDICIREHFHTERYIFPVGYEVTRRYLSTTDPMAEVVYHCNILDGGDGPKFRIVAADMPDKPVIAGTATGAWSTIVKEANRVRNRQHSNSVSGPDFFGLGQNTIKHLIQELPNAKNLKDYVWQHFVEGGPLGGRHAAVLPALPDDGEGSPPPGTVYFEHPLDSDRSRELHIIHVDNEDPRMRQALPPPPNMKPITFHQEYVRPPEREREMERRNSYTSNASYDDYGGRPDSPPRGHRPHSHSPSMQRDREREHERDHYSPHQHQLPPPPSGHVRTRSQHASPHHHSPYQTHAHHGPPPVERERMHDYGAASPSLPPPPSAVPATLASIMHAYPQAPLQNPPALGDVGEYAYTNGGRRNGHGHGHGLQTFPPGGGER